jgi:hypothetical protein
VLNPEQSTSADTLVIRVKPTAINAMRLDHRREENMGADDDRLELNGQR